MKELVGLMRTLVWVAFGAAIYQELRKPPEARTWNGKVAGVIPYDFRIPTLDRLRAAYWDPDRDQIFSENVFGVGWAVNIPVAARKLSEIASQYAESSASLRRRASRRELPPGADEP
ncbi:MAG TPA: hypothetical protein VJP45_13700 [Candidatus Limnocylindria bacterium]|nr:hypothetical protein [Candidatus Limnocylindria bacterium]